jgi:hypothetical protein
MILHLLRIMARLDVQEEAQGKGPMALYEIRTMLTRHRTSLISFGEFANDLSAILAARELLRMGEALEVWRSDVLVYRTGPNVLWHWPAMDHAREKLHQAGSGP